MQWPFVLPELDLAAVDVIAHGLNDGVPMISRAALEGLRLPSHPYKTTIEHS